MVCLLPVFSKLADYAAGDLGAWTDLLNQMDAIIVSLSESEATIPMARYARRWR